MSLISTKTAGRTTASSQLTYFYMTRTDIYSLGRLSSGHARCVFGYNSNAKCGTVFVT